MLLSEWGGPINGDVMERRVPMWSRSIVMIAPQKQINDGLEQGIRVECYNCARFFVGSRGINKEANYREQRRSIENVLKKFADFEYAVFCCLCGTVEHT